MRRPVEPALIPLPVRAGESLRDELDRLAQVHTAERECARLETQSGSEKQFTRKMEINRLWREAITSLQALRGKADK